MELDDVCVTDIER